MKKVKIIVLCCLILSLMSTTCEKYNMATDGMCTSSFNDLPMDSIYSVIACHSGAVKSRIEQLIKPVHPFTLNAEKIQIVYNDSVYLPFVMKNVWGNNIDSILIDGPTMLAFEFNLIDPCNGRYPYYKMPSEAGFIKNPTVRLIEKQDNIESTSVLFDLNQPYLDIMDEHFEELFKHCCENGVYSDINPWLYKNRPLLSDTAFLNSMHSLYLSNQYKAKEHRNRKSKSSKK